MNKETQKDKVKLKILNILPVNDLKPHIENGKCKCSPAIETVSGTIIITHNAFDCRELIENIENQKN